MKQQQKKREPHSNKWIKSFFKKNKGNKNYKIKALKSKKFLVPPLSVSCPHGELQPTPISLVDL